MEDHDPTFPGSGPASAAVRAREARHRSLAIGASLRLLRAVHGELAPLHAGMGVLHLEAAIAALEDQVRPGRAPA